jgi:hypothetical protein
MPKDLQIYMFYKNEYNILIFNITGAGELEGRSALISMYVFPVSIIPSSLIYGKKEETRKQIYLFYIFISTENTCVLI